MVCIPSSIAGLNLNSASSRYCYARSRESDNVAVFWEDGFGSDPSTASGDLRVDMTKLLSNAEKAYSMYLDTMEFAVKGSSVTDTCKLMIFLLDTSQWTANGAGEDDRIGCLWVNYAAAKIESVIAHEMGHCFQYITGCDTDGGYRYGFGEDGAGGNGFWEQCAQWQAYRVYPEEMFTVYHFDEYIKSNHLHILHENPRYANYFLPEYWTFRHGIKFIGKLWRESRYPEDPVETYKRLNSLSQEQFNDEMHEHAARLTTWDIPDIEQYGEDYIDSRAQVKMGRGADNYWLVDSSVCIENYGYNSIKLNPPPSSRNVTVRFRGKVNEDGYRSVSTEKGGWRFGFVALLENGTRAYSETGAAGMNGSENPEETLTFLCPDNCDKLWLVVSGAPQEHWRHEWDDAAYNDEQWPYEVAFINTNLLGEVTGSEIARTKRTFDTFSFVSSSVTVALSRRTDWRITDLRGRQVRSGYGSRIDIRKYATGGYVLDCNGKSGRILKMP